MHGVGESLLEALLARLKNADPGLHPDLVSLRLRDAELVVHATEHIVCSVLLRQVTIFLLITSHKCIGRAVYDIIVVSNQLWQSEFTIAVEIDAVKYLLCLLPADVDIHLLEGAKQLIDRDIVVLISIDGFEQVFNRATRFTEGNL